MRKFLARLLWPKAFEAAQAYQRLWMQLDEARWWLGSSNPEAAALAQFIIERDAWFWSRDEVRRDMPFCPPGWVISIDSFRVWLQSKPFARQAKDRE